MNIGIICEVNYFGSESDKYTSGFGLGITSFYYAMRNLFTNLRIVRKTSDLLSLDYVLIPNYHWGPHKSIWMNSDFLQTCTNNNILCIFWSGEQILSQLFPWNRQVQDFIEKFPNLTQTAFDVDDSVRLNLPIGRGPNSIEYKFLNRKREKKDRIVFVGNTNQNEYKKRDDTLKELILKHKNIDIFPNGTFRTCAEYFDVISNYRFSICPHSTSFNGITSRFYDALLVNTIPLQQVYPNTLDFFPQEKNFEDVIFFENVNELIEKIEIYKQYESFNEVWLENILSDFFIEKLNFKF